MRAARLIKMVLLLQTRGAMTAAELAERLEVSERTVARDAVALSEAGVPVYTDRGRTGGYRLVGGYRTRLTGLGRSEAEALFLSGVPSALRDMGLQDAASAARLKVSAALLPELRGAPDSAAQRFHLDAPGWYQEPETPALLPAIAGAVWDDRLLGVRYRRKDREVERALQPYGLVLKAGVWYLAARATPGTNREVGPADGRDTRRGGAAGTRTDRVGARTDGADARTDGTGALTERGFRVYRIDRFTAVAVSEERFLREEAFDLPAFWEERAAAFARSILRDEVVLRLTEAGARQLRYVTDRAAADEALACGEPDERGRITVTLPVETLEVAFGQLLALGPEAEVLEPAGLRARFAASAARFTALYAEDRPEPSGPSRTSQTSGASASSGNG